MNQYTDLKTVLPLLEDGNARVSGNAIRHCFGQSLKTDSGCDQSLDAGLCDRRCQRFAGTGVRSDAEGEDSSLFSENIESLRVRIYRRVAVGGGQNNENRVARFHFLVRDYSVFGEEAARV